MWGKHLIGIAIAGVLLAAIAGGAVIVQSDEDQPGTFAGKVAAILNLDENAVRDAFKQAKREIQDERIQMKLSPAVEAGKMTQEQADAKFEWYRAGPEVQRELITKKLQAALSQAVEAGKMTQEQADAKFEDFQSRPDKFEIKRQIGKRWHAKHRKR